MRETVISASPVVALSLAVSSLLGMGCGDLTEGGPSLGSGGRSIGAMSQVAWSSGFEPLPVTIETGTFTGTGSLGTVKMTAFAVTSESVAPDAVAVGPDDLPYFGFWGKIVRINEDDTVEGLPMPQGMGYSLAMAVAEQRLWLTSWGPDGIIRLDPTTMQADLFAVPGALRRPSTITASGSGDLWVGGADNPVVGRIAPDGEVFVVAGEVGATPITISTGGLAITKTGDVFATDYQKGRVGRVRGTAFQWIDVGGEFRAPSGITATPDGAVWFVDLGITNRVGRIDGQTGSLQTFELPAALQAHTDGCPCKSLGPIVAGADGSIWFTVPARSAVGRITSAGAIEYVVIPNSLPRALALDSRGRLWLQAGVMRLELMN